MPAELQIAALGSTPAVRSELARIEAASFTEPWSIAEFDFLSRDERSLQIGLFHDGRLVGYAMALTEGEECHLINLAVEPAHRRMGWGRQLVRRLAQVAASRGCRHCHLEVRKSNEAALRLYEGLGFQQAGIRLRYYTQPIEDACLMERRLPLPGR